MPRQTDPIERFASRFIRSTPQECWEWTGPRLPSGYGVFWPFGRAGGKQFAHRFSYELHVGSIPDGFQVDHLCRNKWCVNPSHLEPVTGIQNVRRAFDWTENDDGTWTCSNGHLVTNPEAIGTCAACFNSYKKSWRDVNGHEGKPNHWNSSPELRAEADRIGRNAVSQRIRRGWTYDGESWQRPNQTLPT